MANSPPPERAAFSVIDQPYARRIEKPWGWELHWTPTSLPYLGKLLHVRAAARLSLQAHEEKRETWLLIDGRAMVIWENGAGDRVETELQAGQGYTCEPGQKHRLIGITDCEIIEVSTPETGTTWRFEDDYARPDETPEQRSRERGET